MICHVHKIQKGGISSESRRDFFGYAHLDVALAVAASFANTTLPLTLNESILEVGSCSCRIHGFKVIDSLMWKKENTGDFAKWLIAAVSQDSFAWKVLVRAILGSAIRILMSSLFQQSLDYHYLRRRLHLLNWKTIQ